MRGAELDPSYGASAHEPPAPRSAWRQLRENADLILVASVVAVAFELLVAMRVGYVGLFNDDVTYAIAARQLAVAHRYDLPVMAGSHLILRFPIGFPLLLSWFWRAGGQNLGVVGVWEVVVAALAMAFGLLAYVLLTRVWGASRLASFLAVTAIAFHPLALKYGSAVMSDLPFAFFGLVALAAIEGMRGRGEPLRDAGGAPTLGRAALMTVVASLALAWTILLRYAGVMALAAGFATLWFDRRRKSAVALGILTMAWLAPWLVWSHLHGPGGYLLDARRSDAGAAAPLLLGRGLHWLAAQALPGLLAPLPFLGTLAHTTGSFKPTGAPIDYVGFLVALGLTAATVRAAMAHRSRMAGLYALFTVGLAAAWSGAFPTLGWDLEVRLLLPVAPLLLAFAFDAVQREVRGLSALRKSLLVVACAGLLAWIVVADVRADSYQQAYSRSLAHRMSGLELAGAYLAHIPAKVSVGTPYPLQAYFYAPRRYSQVYVTPQGLRQARAAGVKLLFAQPFYWKGHDYTAQTVHKLLRRHLAQMLFVASPHIAVVRLLEPPATRHSRARRSRESGGTG